MRLSNLILAILNLSITRGGRVLIDGLSFEVGGGEALALTGPNGAGKTTLLRTIAGFIEPSRGTIALVEPQSRDPGPLAERCHFVGHLNAVRASLTVEENARFWCRYLGGSDAGVEAAIDRVGLGELASTPTGYLSAGQKRRLALARLLLSPRPLWLLDEPTAALDAAGQAMLVAIADAHLDAGGLIVAATHAPLGFQGMRELRLGASGGESVAA